MQHAGLFLYPRTRKLITSSLHMNKIRRAPTFLTPPPPPPKRRKSQSTKSVSWKCKEGVKVFNYWRRKHEDDIKLRSKKEIQSQKIHPLRSYPVINKIIWPLIIHHHIFFFKRFHCPMLISPASRSPLLKFTAASFPCRKRIYMYRKSARSLSMVIFLGNRKARSRLVPPGKSRPIVNMMMYNKWPNNFIDNWV